MLEFILATMRDSIPEGTEILVGQEAPDELSGQVPPDRTLFLGQRLGLVYVFDARMKEWRELCAWHDVGSYGVLFKKYERPTRRKDNWKRLIRLA